MYKTQDSVKLDHIPRPLEERAHTLGLSPAPSFAFTTMLKLGLLPPQEQASQVALVVKNTMSMQGAPEMQGFDP